MKVKKQPDVRVTFRLPVKTHRRAAERAARERRSLNTQLVLAVERGLR